MKTFLPYRWVLRYDASGDEVLPGDTVVSHRGETYFVRGGTPPHKQGSTGRVHVEAVPSDDTFCRSFFPTVFNMKWHQEPSLAWLRQHDPQAPVQVDDPGLQIAHEIATSRKFCNRDRIEALLHIDRLMGLDYPNDSRPPNMRELREYCIDFEEENDA